MTSTEASRASFFSILTVLVLPIINGLSGRAIRLSIWIGALVAFVGVACLEQGGSTPSVVDVWCIASAIFALGMVRIEHHGSKLE